MFGELNVYLRLSHSMTRSKLVDLVFNGVPASCFPASTGLGSSFDVDLAAKVGEALGEECKAKGMSKRHLYEQILR